MHQVKYEKNKIKIIFDKKIQGWTWDKNDIKYVVSSYKDHASILLVPGALENFQGILEKAKEGYNVSEDFFEALDVAIKRTETNDVKLKLLKAKVTLETVDQRPFLINHKEPLPFKNQRIQLEYGVRFPAFYNLDEMGLGKTRVAIERYVFLKERLKKVNKSFVICPAPLLYSWANEIKKWSDCTFAIIDGTRNQKLELFQMFRKDIDFWIINFEGIQAIHTELLNFIDKRTNIIIDEFIKIKNPDAKRTKNTLTLCDKTDYIHALCGTPITQGSIDIFSPSLAVDKGRKFGFSYDRFKQEYYWNSGRKLVPKAGTGKKISAKLYENALRFTKRECNDLPDKLYTNVDIELPAENRKAYEQMAIFSLAQIQEKGEVTAPIILVQLLRLSQITSGFSVIGEEKKDKSIVEFTRQPKLDAVGALLDANNSHQIVIWSRFVRDVKAIAKLCKDRGMTYGCLVGQDSSKYESEVAEIELTIGEGIVTPKITGSANDYSDIVIPRPGFARQQMLDEFKFGNIQVVIGTAATGGLGINELVVADKVIYYANDYTLLNRLQSEDRTDSRGAVVHQCHYYDILAMDTIDIGIRAILMGKQKVADVITRDNVRKLIGGSKL